MLALLVIAQMTQQDAQGLIFAMNIAYDVEWFSGKWLN
jgi:hypothetical protein